MIPLGPGVGQGAFRSPRRVLVWLLLVVCLSLPTLVLAGDLATERQVQHDLLQSQALLRMIAARQQAGKPVTGEIAQLKSLAGAIGANHQLLRERFTAREGVAAGLGPLAAARQAAMDEAYLDFIAEYLNTIGALPDDAVPGYLLDTLKSRLESLLPTHPAPLLGALPYRHLRLPNQLPATSPVVTPAYLDKKRPFAPEDLAGSPEAPITPEIAALAQSLHWVPARIYGWVKNNIKSEWYWGVMKGATETLHQRSGNDADQAALLVALLRASGYPARFVRGTIEPFPDPKGFLARTGVGDVQSLAGFFQKAGIPWQPVIKGGVMANLRIEHIWVETYISYDSARGATVGTRDKTWLGLDTQIKLGKVTTTTPAAWPPGVDPAGLPERYLAADHPESPLEFLRAEVTSAGADYDHLLHQRAIADQLVQIVPASLPFHCVAVTGEYTTLPEELTHRAHFTAHQGETTFFDATLPLADLSNRPLAVTYEPATVEDQEIINAYGGLGNTPAYLVHLRPVLTVDGERTLIGHSGLPVGSDFTLTVELVAPNYTERIENWLIIGNLAVLGLVAQQPVLPSELPLAEKTAERLLFERALAYIDQGNRAESELASLLDLPLVRPLPTLVTVGGVVEVVRLLDTPHGFEWRGVSVDAGFRAVELVGEAAKIKTFMRLAGLQGSVLEERVLSEGFGVQAVSTARLLGLSNGEELPPLVLTRANLAAELPGLGLPANVAEDITNAVGQGLTVTLPPVVSSYEDWQGVGYLKEDPDSGEAGWMLSGAIAGGMTAINPERWPADYYDILSHPFSTPPIRNPAVAESLRVIPAGDAQQGVAGQPLSLPLQVVAMDRQGRRVAGVTVNFTIRAGGGQLSSPTGVTDSDGIASVALTLGQHIGDNPTTRYATPHNRTVGENIVDAVTANGLRLPAPFTAFAFPGEPEHLKVYLKPRESNSILYWAGPLGVKIEDRYGNNISNEPVTFTMGSPVAKMTCNLVNRDDRPGLLAAVTDGCFENNVPLYGECGDQALKETTGEDGAAAQVFLGGVPDADYPVTIWATGPKTKQIPPQTVAIASRPFGNCDGLTSPEVAGKLQDIGLVDGMGYAVNAAKVGGSVPIMARMCLIRELEGDLAEGTLYCPDGVPNRTCQYPLGTRQYLVDTELSHDSYVSMAPNGESFHATPLGHGLFSRDYPVGNIPGIYPVEVRGWVKTAANVTLIEASCDPVTGDGACGLVQGQVGAEVPWLIKNIIAVDIELPHNSYTIPVDSEGYALVDTPIDYTILPYVPGDQSQSYIAGNAFVEISEKKTDGSREVVRYLDTERFGPGKGTLARSFRFIPGSEYVAQVVLNQASNAVEIRSGEISLKPVVVNLDLVPDYNRDGKIDEADKGKVTPEKPWRFWINDDNDKKSDELTGLDGDDTPGTGPDYHDEMVNGIRDLVDFFPLHLELGKALVLFPPSVGYTYSLRQADSALGIVESSLTVDEANFYLEDLDVAAGLRAAPVKTVDGKGLALSSGFLEAVAANQYRGVLLLEGRKESTASLALEIRDPAGAVVIAQNFPLEIVSIAAMTGHKDLRPVAGGSPGDPSRKAVSPPYAMTEGSNKILVWMHGYNVNAVEARATYAEVFKRFFHAGLMGQFYGVSWFGDPPDGTVVPIPHYHQAVVNAFATAQDFAVFVEGLDGEVSIAAHSLGNLVAGAAIQDYNLTKFSKYFAVDAAVALEAYGQMEVDEGMVTVDNWLDYWKYDGVDNQGNPVKPDQKLLASEWYKLFPTSDNRSKLTWRNRLDQVPSSKVYNFYSSTEDVLRSYPEDDIATVIGLLQNITALKEYLAISAFVKEEKYKGRSLAMNAGGVSSPFFGWSFSNHYWKFDSLSVDHRRHFTPEEAANEIGEMTLKTQPFFALDTSQLSSYGLDNLVASGGTIASDFVMKKVNATGLKSYYTDNAPAQDRVRMKEWLLAEAFPATTLPMGANGNDKLVIPGQNIDMSGVRSKDGGCCKTEELRWPRQEPGIGRSWWHSDYKNMTYQHVYAFYKKIVELKVN